MIVLDTNVVSVLMRKVIDPQIDAWFDAQQSEFSTTAITIFEIRHGLATHPDGRKRRELSTAFENALQDTLGGRVLNLDEAASSHAARILAAAQAVGRPIEFRDALIAGTVAAHNNASLATRNVKHFADAGIPLIDPWSSVTP